MIRYFKKTKAYQNFKLSRIARRARSWTEEDEARKRFYTMFLKPGDICFDIGANVGNRTKIFSKIVGPQGRVIAVEPQSYCMKILYKAFRTQPGIVLEKTAMGASPGQAEIYVSNEKTVSSMSREWIDSVKKTNRFGAETDWNQTETVNVTTLDRLIDKYREPAFIKIDVEGFEEQVIAGLSHPIRTCFSLEFTPEYKEATYACISRLGRIGSLSCNYSTGESMTLDLKEWVGAEAMMNLLEKYAADTTHFGDVYIRLTP